LVRSTAGEIVGDEKNAWSCAQKIARWISREILFFSHVNLVPADKALILKIGDDKVMTALMIAFCRSLGIPSRAAFGLVYDQQYFVFRFWPEVYVGRWIPLDPAKLSPSPDSAQLYADAGHLKLAGISFDENIFKSAFFVFNGLRDKLKIEVLESSKPKK
jgi:transglutaminase-like putative cysteine protease